MLREVDKNDRQCVKALLDMDSRMKRNSLVRQVKAANKEEITISKVHNLCKKMEQQYIQEVKNIYKEKIVKLEEELEERTHAIQSFIRNQDNVLQKELAVRKRKTKLQKAACKQNSRDLLHNPKKRDSRVQHVAEHMRKTSRRRSQSKRRL